MNGTCSECKYWERDIAGDYRAQEGKPDRACARMETCLCCTNDEAQLAGMVGGGEFRSLPTFGCVMFAALDAPRSRPE